MNLLPLPISTHDFAGLILEPALDLLPAKMGSIQARVMVLSIALQESGLSHRWQVVDPNRSWVKGPARGLMQFERGGGVRGVLTHPASRDYADRVCRQRGIQPTPRQVYDQLDNDDILAVALGRLLLWTDPRPLPAIGSQLDAWNLYQRVWRPGHPRIEDWPDHYKRACRALGAT